ncbi:hypothetical protein F5884DRAFT_709128 [Xylogone sp. PMI_703]|nr:hypothetical protein F5884DRAFT_709128 [Xylogone sp. PMI_703]
MPGFLRRLGPTNDVDVRRHSFYAADIASSPAIPENDIITSRTSEQLPRRPSAAEFLSPDSAAQLHHYDQTSPGDSAGLPALRPISSPVHEAEIKHRRFSLLKFRHASDSQLSARARMQAEEVPPLPRPPEIITTAPTFDINTPSITRKKSKMRLPSRSKSNIDGGSTVDDSTKPEKKEHATDSGSSSGRNRVTFDEPRRSTASSSAHPPPAYGDEATSTLALPVTRLSESSRSDGSSGDHGIYATTTTTHTIQTTTTFFRLPRRKKQAAPMFDLSHLPKAAPQDQFLTAPRASTNGSRRSLGMDSPPGRAMSTASIEDVVNDQRPSPLASPAHSIQGTSSQVGGTGSQLSRATSNASVQSSPSHRRIGLRNRSSTLSSLRNEQNDDALPTPTLPSARTSTSTGRKSFGDIFGLSHRLRQNSEPSNAKGSGPATPGSTTSKNNSMQLVRDTIVLPERHEDDTPAKYLVRLEEVVSRGVVASVLSKGTDPFSQAVLRSYMRGFGFFGDPMDMAIRKLLMEAELPKETQQIDRCLQGFANRYHECNPGIYATPDQAYFVAFSLLILHTDVFNKNNKHKMQKADYIKNTRGEGIFDEILECFYDNISYTPFIHVEDDLDINGERIVQHQVKKKSLFPRGAVDPTRRPLKEPIDPYTLIIDGRLDTLRPNLKDVMHLEDHYSYLGTATSLNMSELQKTFFRTGVLQIVSARSRPDAFMSEKTVSNPEEAHPGIVDIKITKVGLLWRKDPKKKKTRSPWQEWGAILTGSQLYFFRNTAWIKSLMHQLETHIKQGHDGIPVIFKPPLEQFKPDALMSTDDAVALRDSTYKKHKNAFIFVRHGGFEETFLADNEEEMNDWLAKLNYAAAFRTSGVRMRGVVGGNYEGQRARGIRRLGSRNDSSRSVQTPTGEVTIMSGKIDTKMQQDILAARREIMVQKIAEAEEKLEVAQKHLDLQLRNARHLQILAPIQQKTREQVILAAARMAAQLKWGRMEIWRLKCHRDILKLDLEDEKNSSDNESIRYESAGATPERASLSRLQSKTGSIPPNQQSPRSPQDSLVGRQPSSSHGKSQQEKDQAVDDGFQALPALSNSSSFQKSPPAWELPPFSFNISGKRKTSLSSTAPTTSEAGPSSAVTDKQNINTESGHRPKTPDVDAAEQEVLEQAGLMENNGTPEGKRPGTGPENEENKDHSGDKEKGDKNKIRRSLQRTLRDAHVPTHTRSRRTKDSFSGTVGPEEAPTEDVLSRGTGSFVVHGKKASVITFGEELKHMSRKQAPKDEHSIRSPSVADDDVRSGPSGYRERHNSGATGSTATGKSIGDLHKVSTSYSSECISTLAHEHDSEVAVSFSEGRRTPLPPVDDGVEDSAGSEPIEGQALFYTPEGSNSPTAPKFMDVEDPHEGDGGEDSANHTSTDHLPNSLPQTVVST